MVRTADTQLLGQAGETLAEQYLQQQGLTLVTRNYRGAFGEIDLIMRDGTSLVFIEVKQRKNTFFGNPAEAVTASKQKKILLTAAAYLQQTRISQQQMVRFDVVGIVAHTGKPPDISWIKHAFQGA